MNDSPTVAALETSATETPVAPVDVAPAVDTAPVTGRQPGARTVAIRKLLEDSNGEATYSTSKDALAAQGFTVDENTFNVTKSAWKRAKLKPVAAPVAVDASEPVQPRKARKVAEPVEKVKPELPEVSVADAFAYVSQQGGLEKAEADLRRRLALVKQFKSLLKQAQKLAS